VQNWTQEEILAWLDLAEHRINYMLVHKSEVDEETGEKYFTKEQFCENMEEFSILDIMFQLSFTYNILFNEISEYYIPRSLFDLFFNSMRVALG
jgi:hypothetical protein